MDPESYDAPLNAIPLDVSSGGAHDRLWQEATERVNDIRYERYVTSDRRNAAGGGRSVAKSIYYFLRPLMPFALRNQLKRVHSRGWQEIKFPSWPVDCTVEAILERLLQLSLETRGIAKIPFIWFWPDGRESCVIMTHDVETAKGRDYCSRLMDIDDRRAVKSSFQIIPEERYTVGPALLNSIRDRGFEINVHDLNHDGHLFSEHEQFLRRVARINRYAKAYGAMGFRSGAMYRNPDWYEAFEFSYDMSFPNVAHLDPQPGGCCTVMPYFIGGVVELPVTTTQDYFLFHILNEYSLDLWKRQIGLITEKHGLVSFIVHPDYIIERKARDTYNGLLSYLAELRCEKNIWSALPSEVDRWWRQRSQMRLIREAGTWQIHGDGKERARVAYAMITDTSVRWAFEQAA
jgi:hypothetical protein